MDIHSAVNGLVEVKHKKKQKISLKHMEDTVQTFWQFFKMYTVEHSKGEYDHYFNKWEHIIKSK